MFIKEKGVLISEKAFTPVKCGTNENPFVALVEDNIDEEIGENRENNPTW